jgi:hypothetical protein
MRRKQKEDRSYIRVSLVLPIFTWCTCAACAYQVRLEPIWKTKILEADQLLPGHLTRFLCRLCVGRESDAIDWFVRHEASLNTIGRNSLAASASMPRTERPETPPKAPKAPPRSP